MNSEHNAFTIQFDNLLITNVKGNAHKLNSLSRYYTSFTDKTATPTSK